MSRITITLHIDLPDGVTPDVDYSSGPKVVAEPPQQMERPVQAVLEAPQEPPHIAAAAETFGGDVAEWPAGDCPSHKRPFKDGQYGPFCSGKGGSGPVNNKGYCDLKPGQMFNGKRIPKVAA